VCVMLFCVLDVRHTPNFLFRLKVQPNSQPVTVSTYWCCAPLVVLNQLLIAVPLQLFAWPLYHRCGMNTSTVTMPTFGEALRDFTLIVLIEEVLFYYSHRLLHTEFLFRYVHRIHHSWTAPIAMASEYAHPVEFLLSNAVPVMAGPILTGCHASVLWLWVLVAVLSTLGSHSGYAFRWSPFGNAPVHDFHHSTFTDNFGATGLLDWLHGTNLLYVKHYRSAGVTSSTTTTTSSGNQTAAT